MIFINRNRQLLLIEFRRLYIHVKTRHANPFLMNVFRKDLSLIARPVGLPLSFTTCGTL